MASSVCRSLQCLISALTQGGEGDHLLRFTCLVMLWGGRNTANKYHWRVCGECSQCLGHTGFAPAHGVCAFPVYTAQSPGCSAGELSKAGPGLHALPRSKPLRFRFSTKAQTRLGLRFVPFPGPSSSGNQVLGKSPFPRWGLCLITSMVPVPQFPGCVAGMPSQLWLVSLLGS